MRTELYGHGHWGKCNGFGRAEKSHEWRQGSLLGMWMGTGSIDIRDNDGRVWHDTLSSGFWTDQVGNCMTVAVLPRGFISPTALDID